MEIDASKATCVQYPFSWQKALLLSYLKSKQTKDFLLFYVQHYWLEWKKKKNWLHWVPE